MTALFVWPIGSVRGFRPLAGFPYLSFPRRYGGSGEHASRWGRLCLACTSVAMDSLRLASMAPPPAHCVCHLLRSGRGGWRYAPSPCGDMVLKLNATPHTINIFVAGFPSPCGDMVLKYDTDRGGLSRDEVSVPLRGYGFEILAVGCLAVPSSICRFAARMYFPSLSRRRYVLKSAVYPTALSAAGISLPV